MYSVSTLNEIDFGLIFFNNFCFSFVRSIVNLNRDLIQDLLNGLSIPKCLFRFKKVQLQNLGVPKARKNSDIGKSNRFSNQFIDNDFGIEMWVIKKRE